MADAISVLELGNKKLAARVEKLRAQLATAETELAEGETAVRVLKRLGLSPTVEGVADEVKPSTQDQVRSVLPTSEGAALTPREVHQAVNGTISADNVRTILKRLKDATGSDVSVTADGRYWRVPPPPSDGGFVVDDDEIDSIIGTPRQQPPAFDDDLDSDVPF